MEIGYLLVANAGLGHRPTDPQASGFQTALSWTTLISCPYLCAPHSLAELEKEIGNLRKGLRAVEVVSTSFLPCGCEALRSGTLGQMVGPQAADCVRCLPGPALLASVTE